ncbi:hypothetical protein V8E55_008356 [Tylopilus felleus]
MTRSPPGLPGSVFGSRPFQDSVYIGIIIENVLYGIELLLYFKTIHILLSSRGVHKKANLVYVLFSSVMLFLITVWIGAQALFGEEMWLLNSDFPGGSGAYWAKNISVWYMDWGTTAGVLLQLMTDGLMIYRCRIIWDSYFAIIMPVILWIATLVLGIAVDWTSSLPGGNFFAGISVQLGVAYYTVSVSLNTILTCMICYRMVRHGRKVLEYLGHEYASSYFAVVALVVESALPFTLSGIVFLVSFGLNSPTSVAFICVYYTMMCISQQLLILRVVAKRAWDKDTSARLSSTVHFNHGSTSQGSTAPLQTLSKIHLPDAHRNTATSPV